MRPVEEICTPECIGTRLRALRGYLQHASLRMRDRTHVRMYRSQCPRPCSGTLLPILPAVWEPEAGRALEVSYRTVRSNAVLSHKSGLALVDHARPRGLSNQPIRPNSANSLKPHALPPTSLSAPTASVGSSGSRSRAYASTYVTTAGVLLHICTYMYCTWILKTYI